MYVNDEYATSADFYHGADRFHIAKAIAFEHNGANAMILYTLSPDTTSIFKNVKICKVRCKGGQDFEAINSESHFAVDPETLLRRRRLQKNNASILNYKHFSILATSLLLFNCI